MMDTIALVRRLAVHYPDTVIAGILNRQGRTTVSAIASRAGRVGNRVATGTSRLRGRAVLHQGRTGRRSRRPAACSASPLRLLHRWLNDGIIPGEQLTPGAPWRIRLTDDLIARLQRDCWGRLRNHARGDPQARCLAPNRVAACQARRARSRARHEWQEKGSPDQGDNPAIRTLQSNLMTRGYYEATSKNFSRSMSTTTACPDAIYACARFHAYVPSAPAESQSSPRRTFRPSPPAAPASPPAG